MKEMGNSQLNKLDFFLSEIPSHWQMNIKLSSIARNDRGSFTNGPFGSDLLTSELRDTGVPVIYIRDIRNGVYQRVSDVCVTLQKAKQLNVCNVSVGDILVAKVGDPPGISAVYPQNEPNAIITQDVIRIKTQSRIVNNAFLVLLLNSQFGKYLIDQITVESTRSRISLGDFKRINIYLPPLHEQTAIATYLDSKTYAIDRNVVLLEQKIVHYQQLRKRLINETVCRGLDKTVKLKDSGIQFIGEIPEHWEVKRLKDLSKSMGSGATPLSNIPSYYENGILNWVNTGDLNDGLINDCQYMISQHAINDYPNLKTNKKGTLLIAMYGATICKIGLLNIEATTNQACCCINFKKENLSKFVFYWFLANKNNIISNIKTQIETLKELRKTLINDVVTGKIKITP